MSDYRNDAHDALQDTDVIGLYDKELTDMMLNTIRLRNAREEGIEKGIEQGVEKGVTQAKQEVARRMLKENISVDIIEKCTGLSALEIRNL